MSAPRSFDDLWTIAAGLPPAAVAVAGADDPMVMRGLELGFERGLVASAILTGDPATLARITPPALKARVGVVAADDAAARAREAVRAVREGAAELLVKGSTDSGAYLRAVVDRETGIRRAEVLSNVTVAEMPSYHKLIAATDNGITPAPDLSQKRAIALNAGGLFAGFGVAAPKVAVLAATEKVSDALPATGDARMLAEEASRGALGGMIVDGPFGYDAALNYDAAVVKGLGDSPVAGDPDILLFSNIEAANAVAKSWKLHGRAKTGSVVLGASVPVLLNSRSDGAERRLNALLLARLAQRDGAPASVGNPSLRAAC